MLRHMSLKLVGLRLTIMTLIGLAVTIGASSAALAAGLDVPMCANAEQIARTHGLDVSRPGAPDTLKLLKGSNLRIASTYQLVGPCAGSISGFRGDLVGFPSGAILGIQQEKLVPVETQGREALYAYLFPLGKKVQANEAREGVVLEHKQCPDSMVTREIEVLPDRGHFQLVEITRQGQTISGKQLVGILAGEVLALGYLPAPDAPGGILTIASEMGGIVMLIRIEHTNSTVLACKK